MSISIMTVVWKASQHKEAALLAMLALADMANDDGYCWPSVEKLAERCRVEPRSINRIINRLEASGEIYIERGGGAGRTNQYIVTVGMDVETMVRSLMHYCGYTRAQATEIAATHLAKNPDPAAQNTDTEVMVSDRKTLTVERETLTVERENPDPRVTRSIIDPSIEPSGSKREAAASPPAPPSPPIDTTTKSLCEQPPIAAYRDVFLRTPSRAQMVQIMAHGVSDLNRWRAALSAWCRRGYSPMNLDGMLDWYDDPGRYDTKKNVVNGNANGQTYDTTIFSCDPSWLYVEPEPAYYPTPGS